MTAEKLFDQYCNIYHFEEGDPEELIDKEDFVSSMKAFATLHVKAAIRAMAISQVPALFEDSVYLEQFVNHVLNQNYPLHEKIV